MADGTKKAIEEIQVGEMIETSLGSCRIIQVFQRHALEPVYRLFADGREVRLTGDHPVKTKAGWIPARDLKVGDKILMVEDHEY